MATVREFFQISAMCQEHVRLNRETKLSFGDWVKFEVSWMIVQADEFSIGDVNVVNSSLM